MIGMNVRTQLKKWRPCCSIENKLQWSVRRPCLTLSLNRFHTLLCLNSFECVLCSGPFLLYPWANWELCSPVSQIWRTGRSPSVGNEEELEERPKWLDRWMATKPWDNRGRTSTDQRDPIKTVEMDTSQPYSYLPHSFRRQHPNQYHQYQQQRPSSPLHRSHLNLHPHHSLVTPSPAKTRPIQVRSASPHFSREDRTYHTSQTPSLKSNYCYNGSVCQHGRGGTSSSGSVTGATLPNYMAATESAKARVRSQSAPRQRPLTPERERVGSVKKRLSFPAPDPYGTGMTCGAYGHNLRSPSFKSVRGAHFGLEQQSNYSSCCTDSLGGEISPSSTSDLRRWLRWFMDDLWQTLIIGYDQLFVTFFRFFFFFFF